MFSQYFSHNDFRREVTLPKDLTKELAEETGIHVGDGSLYMSKKGTDTKYVYNISGGYDDELYFQEFVIPLIYRLYHIHPLIYKPKKGKSIELRYQSKALAHFKKSLGLPVGKKDFIETPKFILSSPFRLDFIRGLFDTDGCLSFKKKHKNVKYYPVIDITSKSFELINQISKILHKQSFTTSKIISETRLRNKTLCTNNRIYLYGKKNLIKWMNLIGTSQPKNIKKFKTWKKLGYLPEFYNKAFGGN